MFSSGTERVSIPTRPTSVSFPVLVRTTLPTPAITVVISMPLALATHVPVRRLASSESKHGCRVSKSQRDGDYFGKSGISRGRESKRFARSEVGAPYL